MRRKRLLVVLVVSAIGCGGRIGKAPTSLQGSFDQIESAIEDFHSNVFGEYYSGGSADDNLSLAVDSFIKATAGTPLAADAEEIRKKVYDLDVLASTQPPVEKLRAAVQDLETTLAAVKKKL
jgi:hypothetical protein